MAKQLWEISGRLMVEESETLGEPRLRPLVGVTVDVRGSVVNNTDFGSWGEVATDSQGFFRLEVEKNQARRDFRVLVRFKDKREDEMLAVNTPPTDGILKDDWYRVLDTPSKVDGPTVNLGTATFQVGASGDLGVRDNVRRAATWFIVTSVMDLLASRPGIEFKNPIKVVYPAKVVSGSSYANGITRTAYIHSTAASDQWNVDTVVHEVMHLWNYQHNTGVANWVAAVCFDGDTHGFQEQPAIAFHEGSAEWAKNELMTQLWGRPRVRPMSRFGLAQLDLNDVGTVERSDRGVLAGLHLLTAPDIHEHVFGTSAGPPAGRPSAPATGPADLSGLSCPASPEIDMFDVLRVFLPHPGQGWPTFWQVGQKEFGLVEFNRRASDILGQFDKGTKALYLELLDAGATVEPQSRCSPRRELARPRRPRRARAGVTN